MAVAVVVVAVVAAVECVAQAPGADDFTDRRLLRSLDLRSRSVFPRALDRRPQPHLRDLDLVGVVRLQTESIQRDLVRRWVLGMFAAWQALMPTFFTKDLQARIPDDFMPAQVVQDLNAQSPDGRRPTLQGMGLLRRMSVR